MGNSGIAPGCVRLTVDLPSPLYSLVANEAERPPTIPTQEYVRRLVAGHFDFPLPSYAERKALGLTLGGAPKAKPGRKPKYDAEEA